MRNFRQEFWWNSSEILYTTINYSNNICAGVNDSGLSKDTVKFEISSKMGSTSSTEKNDMVENTEIPTREQLENTISEQTAELTILKVDYNSLQHENSEYR